MTAARPLARFSYSDHLVRLCARAEVAAAHLAAVDPARRATAAVAARRLSARLSARLDGSPLTDATAEAVDAGRMPAVANAPGEGLEPVPAGGWARALKLDGMATQEVAAVEYANLVAAADAAPRLAATVLDRPLDTLVELHRLVCTGLVAPDVAGRPRQTAQAVMDGSQGRVLFNAPDPGVLPERLDALADWIGGRGSRVPALVAAGVAHERLLEWQPFEAGNGRLARAFGALILRARSLDTDGIAVVERGLAADPIGYYGEVAATIRRQGDLGPWLERWGAALVAAMEATAVGLVPEAYPAPPAGALAVVAELPSDYALTIGDYADRRGCSPALAAAELEALARAGVVAPEVRTRGLRVLTTP